MGAKNFNDLQSCFVLECAAHGRCFYCHPGWRDERSDNLTS
jgi:hypothetical protein